MRRIVGSVVIGLVTVPAGAAGQAVVVAHVALGALHRQMETGEGEARGGVIERGAGPVQGCGSVAAGAVLRESGGQVRRAGGAIVVGLVAVPAGRAGQAEVIVHVARGALLAGVETYQCKAGGRVIERGAGPVEGRGSVAQGAFLRVGQLFVRRSGGSVVVGLVAVPAGCAGQAVVVVHVARGTLLGGMQPHRRERGSR